MVGCSSLYRHSVETDAFSLYGDNDPERLERLASVVETTMDDFDVLFELGEARIPPPRVIYEEDDLSRARIYTSEMRQEGFYLPLLRLVHLSPRHYSNLDNDLHDAERVVRHELAHHFLIQRHPASGSRYWLNEGVACALEAPFVTDEDGQSLAPLYHQWLHEQAHLALQRLGTEKFTAALQELLASGWFGFHQSGSKVRNYALSWAFTYYQLQQIPGTFARRVEVLVARKSQELQFLIPGFLKWLSEDPNRELDALAGQPALRLWTLRTWLNLTQIDGALLLRHLLPLLTDAGTAKDSDGVVALSLLTRLLNRPAIGSLSREQLHDLRSTLAARLTHGTDPEKQEIASTLRRSGYSAGYLRPLVTMLSSQTPDVRVAAARALARLSAKPTITRPSFWTDASPVERAAEVSEWEQWLGRRSSRR